MPQSKVLVREFGPVDRLPAAPVPARKVPSLAHERRDDAVEARAHKPFALGARRELGKVGGGARDDVLFQLEDYSAERGSGVPSAQLEVEEGLGVVLLIV